MKTDNKNSEKDLNANPNSELNTNKPLKGREHFPESQQAKDEAEKRKQPGQPKKDDDIELLANDVKGTVSTRDTSSSPADIAGVSDLDNGMRRARRK